MAAMYRIITLSSLMLIHEVFFAYLVNFFLNTFIFLFFQRCQVKTEYTSQPPMSEPDRKELTIDSRNGSPPAVRPSEDANTTFNQIFV